MPTITRIASIGLLMLVGPALPADAQWRWLEHMSGPGWYDGFSIEQKVFCRYPEQDPPKPEQDPPKKETVAAPTISLPCWIDNAKSRGDSSQHRFFTFGVSGALLWSTINRLQYSAEVTANSENTQVWVLSPGVFADVRLLSTRRRIWLDNLELGVAFEAFRMDSKVMKPLWRWAREPRLTVNVVSIRNTAAKNIIGHVKLRAGVLWLDSDMDSGEFGAIAGTTLSRRQAHTSIRVLFDVECLPWKKEKCGNPP